MLGKYYLHGAYDVGRVVQPQFCLETLKKIQKSEVKKGQNFHEAEIPKMSKIFKKISPPWEKIAFLNRK